MNAIDPRFLNANGFFDYEAAQQAGREARAQAMRAGLAALADAVRRVARTFRQGPIVVDERLP